MILSDTLITTTMSDTRRPALSLIKNAIEKDPRRAASVRAFAPFGKLDLTGNDDLLILATASVPVYFSPVTPGTRENFIAGEKMKLDTALFDRIASMRELVYFDNRPDDNGTRFPIRPKTEFGKWIAFRDSGNMWVMIQEEDFALLINDIQSEITWSVVPKSYEPKLIGLAGVLSGAQDGKLTWGPKPKTQIRFERNAMQISVPHLPIKASEMRVIYPYTNLLACALNNLYKVVNEETKQEDELGVNDDFDFWHSQAAFMLAAYGGLNKDVNLDKEFTALDIQDKVISYLGLPFSDAYPHLSLRFNHGKKEENDRAVARVLKAVLLLNIILCFAAERVGCFTLPVEYLRVTMGSRHLIKAQLQRYLVPPHDLGGSYPFWLPLAYNGAKRGMIMLPHPVEHGYNEYVPMTTYNETFTEILIDRGEISKESVESLDGKIALVTTTRDVRVHRSTDAETRESFLMIRFPSPPASPKNREYGIHWYLSYLTDGEMRPGPALDCDDSFAKPRANVIARGWSPVYKLDDGKEIKGVTSEGKKVLAKEAKPMPGGLASEDRSAEHVREIEFKALTSDKEIAREERLDSGAVERVVEPSDAEQSERG